MFVPLIGGKDNLGGEIIHGTRENDTGEIIAVIVEPILQNGRIVKAAIVLLRAYPAGVDVSS